MNKTIYRLVFVCSLVWLAGCVSNDGQRLSTKEHLISRNPHLTNTYVELNETSLSVMKRCFVERFNSHQVFVKELERRLDDGRDVRAFLKQSKDGELKKLKSWSDFHDRIQKNFDPKTESLFEYRVLRGDSEEWGF